MCIIKEEGAEGMGKQPEKCTASYPAQHSEKVFFLGDVKAIHGGEINVCARAAGFSFLHQFSGPANLQTLVLSHVANDFLADVSANTFFLGIY